MQITLQDINNLTNLYPNRYRITDNGETWEKGYISVYLADPECPDSEYVICPAFGNRKGEYYYKYPSSKSSQYYLRCYIGVYDEQQKKELNYTELCNEISKIGDVEDGFMFPDTSEDYDKELWEIEGAVNMSSKRIGAIASEQIQEYLLNVSRWGRLHEFIKNNVSVYERNNEWVAIDVDEFTDDEVDWLLYYLDNAKIDADVYEHYIEIYIGDDDRFLHHDDYDFDGKYWIEK